MKLNKMKFLLMPIMLWMGNLVYAQDSIPLNLASAIELALERNRDITVANYEINSSEYAVKEAKGNFLPTLTASGSYDRNFEKQVIFFPDQSGEGSTATELGSDNDYSGTLSLSLPVYSKYNTATKAVAEKSLDYQKEAARGTRLTIIKNAKKLYFTYLITQEVVNVQQNLLDNSEDNLENIQIRRDQGNLTDYDLTSAKVQVAQVKSSLLEAQSNLMPAANDLKNLLGLKIHDSFKLTEGIEDIEGELTLNENSNVVLESNSTLKQLAMSIDLSDKQVGLVKSGLYPTLSIVGSYNYQTQADDFNFSEYNWVSSSLAGLSLSYTIFDGKVTKNQMQQYQMDTEIARENLNYAARDYQFQYEEVLSQLDFSRQKVAVQKENMALTVEALALVKKRYENGVSTFLEVSDAESSYAQARLDWLQAIYNYKTAYYDYELLIGKED